MRYQILNIEFEPVENAEGLRGFVSFEFNHVQWNKLAVFSRQEGGIRVAWPERQRGTSKILSARPKSPKALAFVDQAVSDAIKAETKI